MCNLRSLPCTDPRHYDRQKPRFTVHALVPRAASYLIFILLSTVGMRLDIWALLHTPGLLMVATVWILIHGVILLGLSFLCRSPFFFMVRRRGAGPFRWHPFRALLCVFLLGQYNTYNRIANSIDVRIEKPAHSHSGCMLGHATACLSL